MKFSVFGVFILLLISCYFTACNEFVNANTKKNNSIDTSHSLAHEAEYIDSVKGAIPLPSPFIFSKTEQSIIGAGCVDIKVIDSSIVVDLKYSTSDNFLGFDVYGDFNTCYLQMDVARKLGLAQQLLKAQFPFYNLIVYDGARPRSVQYKMWNTLDIPYRERSKYLSNPDGGSLHNFGAAVDLSIINENGYVLDMGTEYDYFGELAYPREEERMIKEGKLSHKQLLNRELLRSVMEQAGFSGITTEWWHFNSCRRSEAYILYPIIE